MQFFRVRRDKRQEQWRHTAVLGSLFVNNSGLSGPKTPVKPQDIAPHAFPSSTQTMSKERMRRNLERHKQRLRREQSDG